MPFEFAPHLWTNKRRICTIGTWMRAGSVSPHPPSILPVKFDYSNILAVTTTVVVPFELVSSGQHETCGAPMHVHRLCCSYSRLVEIVINQNALVFRDYH